MTKLNCIILAILALSGCTSPDPLTVDDLFFLLRSGEATSSFDENNMHIYSSHIDRARKLEKFGLITVKTGSLDVDDKTVLYSDQHTTDLGKAVISKINNKLFNPADIPHELIKQLDDLEVDISKKYNLTLRQFIFLTHTNSGDIGAPDEKIFTVEMETIDLVKSLSNEGYLQYKIYDDTFNGKPAKNFRWWPTKKGIEFDAD